jgi:hypothetical protein
MAFADGLRAIGVVYHGDLTAFPSFAGADLLSHDTSFEHQSNIGHDTPDFQRYARMVEVEDYATTIADSLTVRGYVDTLKVGYPLVCALGSEMITASTHTFPSTVLADVIADNPCLAFFFTEGQNDGTDATMHCMGNARVTSLDLYIEAPGGRLMFEYVCVGLPFADSTLALASITFPDPVTATDRFVPGMGSTYVTKAGTSYHLISFRVKITNEAPPVYGTRYSAGVLTGAAPLPPYRFENGAIKCSGTMVLESREDANAAYGDYQSGTERAWVVNAAYAPSSHTLQLQINRAKQVGGNIDRSNPGSRQRLDFKGLVHAGTKSVLRAVLTNSRTTKYNS